MCDTRPIMLNAALFYLAIAALSYGFIWLAAGVGRRRLWPMLALALAWPSYIIVLPLLWWIRAGHPKATAPRVLLVCSAGGHLLQMQGLIKPLWSGYERQWVCLKKADATSLLKDEKVIWAYGPTNRNIPNLLRNLWLSVRVMRDFGPTCLVSTGAGVAIPFFVLGWVLGIKTIYIESFARKTSFSLTGRIVRLMADRFIVQSETLAKRYPDTHFMGTVY